jgi:hypothetical protein
MKWHNETRRLAQLIPFDYNPRQLTEKQYADLKASLTKFDLAEIPAINTDNTIIAGHQRIRIFAELHGMDYEIDVRVPDKKLGKKDLEEYLIRSNLNTGEWDWDVLANEFDTSELFEWGFDEKDFGRDSYSGDNQEIDAEMFPDEMTIKLQYTQSEYNTVLEQLSNIAGTPEQAVWKLLGNKTTMV